MKEYIDRAITLDTIGVNNNRIWNEVYDIPVADVVGVRHGRWIVSEMNLGYCDIIQKEYIAKKYTCSECGYETGDQANKFACCPICMARMDKEADHD